MNLGTDITLKVLKVHTTAATTNLFSAPVDTAGAQGVFLFTRLGTAGASNKIKAQQNTTSATTGMTDLAGTALGVGSSDEQQWIDIHRPQERWVRVFITRTTSTTIETVYALLYGQRSKPTDNTVAGTIHGEVHASPDEGTA